MNKTVKIILAVLLILAVAAGIAFAVYKAGGKKTEGNVNAFIEDFSEDANIFESAKKYPDRYVQLLENGMDMEKEEIDSFLNNPEEWLAYNAFIFVENDTDSVLAFTSASINDNGKDGLYISRGVGGSAVTIPEHKNGSIVLTVLLHSPDPSMDEVREMVEKKDIKLMYAPVTGDSFDDIPQDNLLELKVG